MTYFELYQLPIDLLPDQNKLKSQFYALSKKYHPDINQGTDPEAYIKTLELSALVNTAYKTLSNFDLRLKYILELLGDQIDPNEALPPDFLMEMMDLNEEVMDAMSNETKKQELLEQLTKRESALELKASSVWKESDENKLSSSQFEDLKSIYFQRKYLLRIRKNLNSFAEL